MLPRLLNHQEVDQIIHYTVNRYGLSIEAFEKYEFVKRKEGLWIHPKGTWNESESGFWEASGLRVFSGKDFPYKLTMAFVHIFFDEIKDMKLELNEEDCKKILRRETIENFSGEGCDLPKGYYIVCKQGKAIGIALKLERELVSQVPKSLKAQLRKDLEFCNE